MTIQCVFKRVALFFWGILPCLAFFSSLSFAQAAGPSQLNISGGLYNPNGTPVTNASVNFRLEVWDKANTCVLYSEQHLGQDLSASKGGFALEIGSGSSKTNNVDTGTPGALTSKVFENSGAVAPFAGCASGLTLASGDSRNIRVYYDLGSGFTAMSPDVPIASSAYAMVADSLQGKRPTDFLQVRDDISTDLNQTNIETIFSAVNFAKLVQILSGNFGGSTVTNVGTPSAGTDAANKNYVDANIGGRVADVTAVGPAAGNGHTLIWDQAQNRWVTGVPSATDNSKLPLAGGTMAGAIAMGGNNLTNVGHITMAAQRTLNLGVYNGAQETTLVGGLAAGDAGKFWYNSDLNATRIWNGTAAVTQAYLSVGGKIAASWIPDTAVAPGGTFGSATQVPVFTVGSDGRITGVTNTTISGVAPAGTAGGDLTGTYPNPTIANNAVSSLKILNDAVTSAKINSTGIAVNRLLITDATTGATVGYKTCNLSESLMWTATGWDCVTAATFLGTTGVTAATYGNGTQVSQVQVNAQGRVVAAANVNIDFPVVTVAGKTGAVLLNYADISGLGAAAVKDFGTDPGDLVELDGGGRILASLLPSSTGDIGDVVAGGGLTGGGSSGAVTLSVDTGVTAGKIVQVGASDRLPAIDGRNLTNVNAVQLQARNVSTTAPTGAQVLTWNSSASTWEPQTLPAGNTGDVTSISAGIGTTGGGLSGDVTLGVDVGVTAGKIVQMQASNKLPAVDGSDLTQINAVRLQTRTVSAAAPTANQVLRWNAGNTSWEPATESDAFVGTVTSVVSGSGLLGGNITSTGTLSVDTGVTAGKIVQMQASNKLPAVDGSDLTQINAVRLQTRNVAATAPTAAQVLTWNAGSSAWEPQTLPAGNIGDVTSVIASTGLTGGAASGDATLAVDVGTTTGKIVQMAASNKLPAVDGSNLIGIAASQVSGVFANGGNSFGAIANIGTNDNYALNLEANGSPAITVLPSGSVGVGTTNPSSTKFHVFDSTSNNSWHGARVSQSVLSTASGTYYNRGLSVDGQKKVAAGITDSGYFWGTVSTGFRNSSTTADNGSLNEIGGMWTAYGHYGSDAGATPQTTYAYGLHISPYSQTGNIGTMYDLYLSSGSGGGTVGTHYGMYQASPTARNYFGGNVGIGTSNPATKLHVSDTSASLVVSRIQNQSGAMEFQMNDSVAAGAGVIAVSGPAPLSMWTNGASRVTVLGNGNMGVGTASPQSLLHVNGVVRATDICDENGANCKDISGGWGAGGDIDGIYSGTGLTGGFASGSGTLSVDVGVTNGKIVQVGASDRLPAIDGRNLTNINAVQLQARNVSATAPTAAQVLRWNAGTSVWEPSTVSDAFVGTVTSVVGGTGLTGGNITSSGTLAIDVGTTTGKIVQVAASNKLPAMDGSNLTAINAAQLQARNVSSTAPTSEQVLTWNSGNSTWEPQTLPAGNTGDITSVSAGLGLTGGAASGDATLAIDVGTVTGKIVQMAASNKLPAVDGSNLTAINAVQLQTRNVASTAPTANQVLKWNAGNSTWYPANETDAFAGTVTSVVGGTGMVGGNITSTGTLAIDVGTTTGKIVQVASSNKLPAMDGSNLTAVNAAQLQTRNVASTAPTASQFLGWNAASSSWEPQTLPAVGGVWSALSLSDTNPFNPQCEYVMNGMRASFVSTSQILAVTNGVSGTTTASWYAINSSNKALIYYAQDNYNNNLDYGSSATSSIQFRCGSGATGQWTTAGSSISYTAGEVGIGTSTPQSALHVVETSTGSPRGIISEQVSSDGTGPAIIGRKARGTPGSLSATQANDTLFSLQGQGYDGSTYRTGASIVGWALDNFNGSQSGSSLSFYTTATGTTTLSERVRINNAGYVGIGTTTPQSPLHVNGIIRATDICDENGANCRDISGGWGAGGDIDGVYTSTGLTGGFASGSGTLAVDVGTVTGKIVQVAASNRLPAMDGSNLTAINAVQLQSRNVASTAPTANQVLKWNAGNSTWYPANETDAFAGTVTSVVGGTGMVGGNITSTGTLAIDVGTTTGKIVQVAASNKLPAMDGSNLTAVNAVQLQARNVASTAPTSGQVLAWNAGNSTWEPKTESGAASGFDDGGNSFGAVATLGTNDNFALNLEANNVPVVTVNTNARVGINTTTPGRALHVYESAGLNPNMRLQHDAADALPRTMFEFYRSRSDSTAPTAGFGSSMVFQSEGLTNGSRAETAAISSVWEVNQTDDTTARDGNLIFSTALNGTSAEKVRITSQGKIGIGNPTPYFDLDIESSSTDPGMRLVSSSGSTARYPSVAVTQYKDTGGGWPEFYGVSSGGTSGAPAVTASGDTLGMFGAKGTHNTSYGTRWAGYMSFHASETHGAGSGGNIRFHTTANGATTVSERLRIADSGNVGVGTTNPQSLLHVNGIIRATDICDETGANCKDISGGWGGGGDIDGVYTSTGLVGGFASGSGTLSVDVGTTTGKIVQVAASNRLPAMDGVNLTNINAIALQSRQVSSVAPTANQVLTWNGGTSTWEARNTAIAGVSSVVSGTGLTGGNITSTGTLAVDVGTVTGKIVQVAASNKLPVMDGSNLTAINAAQLQTRNIASTAPTANQVLTWNAGNSTWYPKDVPGGATGFINGGNSFGAAATLGTNDNYGLNFETGGATHMTVNADGTFNFGGSTLVDGRFEFMTNPWSETAGEITTQALYTYINGTDPGSADFNGIHNHIISNRTGNQTGTVTGTKYLMEHNGAAGGANLFALKGEDFRIRAGAQTVSNAYGINILGEVYSTGSFTNFYGINIQPSVDTGSGSIANNYGLYIGNQNAGSTSNYAIYSNGGQSYFAGNVGVGTASPGAPIHVLSSAAGGPMIRIDASSHATSDRADILIGNWTWGQDLFADGNRNFYLHDGSNARLFFDRPYTSGTDFNSMTHDAIVSGGNSPATTRALRTTFVNSTTGTTSDMMGAEFESRLTNSGSVTRMNAIRVGAGTLTSTGSISEAMGLSVYNGSDTGTGSIGTLYGVKIENITAGTNNFSLYTGTAKSYFGGNVGIGTTSPGLSLDIQGSQTNYVGLNIDNTTATGSPSWHLLHIGSAGYNSAADGSFQIYKNGNGTSPFTITPSNEIGIGIHNPVTSVTIDGTAHGGNDSPLTMYTSAANDVFGVLPWQGSTILSSGTYYKNGAWVHDGYNTGSAIFSFGSTGATWYASSTSSASWNLASNVTLWTSTGVLVGASSRDFKENFTPLDKNEVLERIARLNISRWNYKNDKNSTHIGPIAEEWAAEFATGEDDKHIPLIDEAGVALAGVQGLYNMSKMSQAQSDELAARVAVAERDIASLKQENAVFKGEISKLKDENAEMKARLERLEKAIGQGK